jgi:hypothetical protein
MDMCAPAIKHSYIAIYLYLLKDSQRTIRDAQDDNLRSCEVTCTRFPKDQIIYFALDRASR